MFFTSVYAQPQKNWLVPWTTNTHNPLQLPIAQQVERDVTSEDLNNLVMKITIELFFLDYFAVPFRDFHPETLQGFVCLSILVKCLNLDIMIGQLMWTEICKPTCWSAGEEQFWNPVGGSCCRRIQPHLLRKYCMGYNE